MKMNIFHEMKRLESVVDLMNGCACIAVPKDEKVIQLSRIPLGNVYETEGSVIATFELPGVEKEDIELNIYNDRIEVNVEKKTETKTEDKNGVSSEMKSSSFYGSLPLPAEVIAENADAIFKNGLLRIEMAKATKQDSKKRIAIK